jgi:hypothetical protein
LSHLADLLFAALMLGITTLAVLRPDVIVRWAKRAHPDIPEDDERILWITRLIGIVGLGAAVLLSVVIFRSLSNG